jgi:hypothetical protein
MPPNALTGNALRRITTDPTLATHGIAAEIAGPRSLKITRNGRYVGVWRQTIASFDWYPAGYNQPQVRVPSPEHVSRFLTTRYGATAASA